MIIIHVDDVLFVGRPNDFQDLKRRMLEFKHGEWERLSCTEPLTYCGITISTDGSRCLEFSQREYYEKIHPLMKNDFFEGSLVKLSQEQVQKKLRAFVGSSLWVAQTRFEATCMIGTLGSKIIPASKCAQELKEFIVLAKETLFRIAIQHIPLRFAPLFLSKSPQRYVQIFSFSDASMASLKESNATEACMIIIGVAEKRNGVVSCKGSAIFWESRKLARICRSSAQSGGIALSNTTEATLSYQIISTEVLIGEYQTEFLKAVENNPIPTPFKKPPTEESAINELLGPKRIALTSAMSINMECFWAWCANCGAIEALSWNEVIDTYLACCGAIKRSTLKPSMRALVLCGCSNVISSVSQGNPKCRDKTNKLMCNHIRDMMDFVTITFNCAPLNLCDCGTKIQGNV